MLRAWIRKLLGSKAQSNGASPGHDLVAVIGCTGTGKSKLAVELAQHVQRLSSSSSSSSSFGNTYANAQIISADSMQVYRGLDVITNKATVGEMGGVQHHLMSFLDAGREYTIKDFTSQAGVLVSLSPQERALISISRQY
ncbi:hypothetical protein CF335_g6785 [Tilletia laevis]|nr:hypothetical protein CF335_g6785 [Tilletia laevis]